MFLHETEYRLGEFILIERSSVLLTWVLQYPMGVQRSGKCYVIGNILVILPWDRHGPGYLRMEFHDHLMKLPIWHKTTFYCFASSLRQVIVGGALTNDQVEQLAVNAINLDSSKTIEPGNFRLGRYKIIAGDNNTFTWRAIGSSNRIMCGTCFIESGILLLDSKKKELDEVTRRLFYSELKLLPPWNKTPAWGHAGSIRGCKESKHDNVFYEVTWNPRSTKSFISDRIPFILSQGRGRERTSDLNTPNNERHKIEWKFLGKLGIFTLESVYNGLRIGVLLLKKLSNYVARKWPIFLGILQKKIHQKRG